MEELHLNRKELLYLSALMGMGNMWGFADPFGDMDDDEIKESILQLQNSLNRKGCLITDAQENLLPEESLQERLLLCKESEKVYLLSSDNLENRGMQLRFFARGDRMIRFECGEEAVLSYCDENWMRQEIRSFFGEGKGEEDPFFLKTAVTRLRRMGSLSRQHFLEELRKSGCEETLALLIADGLQGNADFKSLVVYRRDGQNETMENKLVTLEFAGGSLMVTADQSGIDYVRLTRLCPEKLRGELTAILGDSQEAVV